MVKIHELNNQFEAEVIRNVLNQEDIYFEFATHNGDPLENVLNIQQGYGTVWVEEEDGEYAKELIEEGLAARPLDPGEGNAGETPA